jgi:hypothetical protein
MTHAWYAAALICSYLKPSSALYLIMPLSTDSQTACTLDCCIISSSLYARPRQRIASQQETAGT